MKNISKVIFHVTFDEISIFPMKKRGGGVEPLNRDSVSDISKLATRVLSFQRSGTKGEALLPLIFFKEIKYLFKMLSFLKCTGYMQKLFLLFLYCLGRGTVHELRSLVRDTFSTRR